MSVRKQSSQIQQLLKSHQALMQQMEMMTKTLGQQAAAIALQAQSINHLADAVASEYDADEAPRTYMDGTPI